MASLPREGLRRGHAGGSVKHFGGTTTLPIEFQKGQVGLLDHGVDAAAHFSGVSISCLAGRQQRSGCGQSRARWTVPERLNDRKDRIMATDQILRPAKELAAGNGAHFPNESDEYRQARNALLAEEIELRRHIERVAEMRRQLPPGGAVRRTTASRARTARALRGPVRRQADARRLQLHVRSPAEAALPDVHHADERHGTARRATSSSAWLSP